MKGAGFMGSIINDIKDNKSFLEPMNDAYETTAFAGLIYSAIKTITVTSICIVVIGIGFYLTTINREKSAQTMGKITTITCALSKDCKATIEYVVGETTYVKKHDFKYKRNKNERIKVYYDSSFPDEYTVDQNAFYFGVFMIFVGFVLVLLAWASFALSYFSKPVRAAHGVDAIIDVFD
jgi:uncharacterized membrane protein